MPAGDVIETVHHCQFGIQASVNVRHWFVGTQVGTGATLEEVAFSLNVLTAAFYQSLINVAATFEGVTAQKILPLPKSLAVADEIGPLNGTVSGEALPLQTAGLISYRTAFAGRSQRGRTYVPFASESQSEGAAIPTLAYRTTLGNLGAVFASPFTAGTGGNTYILAPVIFHRATNTFDPIIAFRVGQYWATQRRRGYYGRPNPPGIGGGFIIT